MKLKKFNESLSGSVWVVIRTYYDGDIEEICSYKNEIDAVDFYINLVNQKYNQKFEPMKENGVRLFRTTKENPDYQNAIDFVRAKHDGLSNNGFIWIYETILQ